MLLILPVQIELKFSATDKNAFSEYNVTIAGIEAVNSKKQTKKKKVSQKGDTQNKKNKSYKISDVINIYNVFSEDIHKLIEYSANNALVFKNIDIRIDYGTGDAATTGITYGIISGIIYTLTGIIDSVCGVQSKSIQLSPDFFNSLFTADCGCILRLRNVHIIIIAIKFLLLMSKIRKYTPDEI